MATIKSIYNELQESTTDKLKEPMLITHTLVGKQFKITHKSQVQLDGRKYNVFATVAKAKKDECSNVSGSLVKYTVNYI